MSASANTHSDQNGYAGIERSAVMELAAAAKMPIQRPNPPPDHSENAAMSWMTPMSSVTHPQAAQASSRPSPRPRATASEREATSSLR